MSEYGHCITAQHKPTPLAFSRLDQSEKDNSEEIVKASGIKASG